MKAVKEVLQERRNEDMEERIMELLKRYEPDSVASVERVMSQGLNLEDISWETMEKYSVSRTAYNLVKAALDRKKDIRSDSPNICNAFVKSQVSAMSIYLMDRADIFHTGILKGITEENLESIGIESLTERKRILEVIHRDIIPETAVVEVDADGRHAFLWGLLGFITVFPLSLALYLLLSGRRDTAAHNLGWGLVLNLILFVICIPLLILM